MEHLKFERSLFGNAARSKQVLCGSSTYLQPVKEIKSPRNVQSDSFRSTHIKYPIVNAINGVVKTTNSQDCVAKT